MHARALHARGAHGVIVLARNRSGHLGRGQDEQEVPAESWRTAAHRATLSIRDMHRKAEHRAAQASCSEFAVHELAEKASSAVFRNESISMQAVRSTAATPARQATDRAVWCTSLLAARLTKAAAHQQSQTGWCLGPRPPAGGPPAGPPELLTNTAQTVRGCMEPAPGNQRKRKPWLHFAALPSAHLCRRGS